MARTIRVHCLTLSRVKHRDILLEGGRLALLFQVGGGRLNNIRRLTQNWLSVDVAMHRRVVAHWLIRACSMSILRRGRESSVLFRLYFAEAVSLLLVRETGPALRGLI